jgi:hypothetical protein
MLADQHGFAGLVGDFEQLDDDAVARVRAA